MKYQFQLTFSPTDGSSESPVQVYPLHSDDLAVSIERKDGEWYYTRKLSGTLTFVRDDYNYIMSRPFDGTFALDLLQSTDGANYYPYFAATFSRASLEIDEDNRIAKLDSLSEGIDDLLSNGKDEEFNLMKLIPDSEAKEVQGQVPPALAMVDYCSTSIDKSDIFCGGAATAGGYDSKHSDSGFNVEERVTSDDSWNFRGVFAEAQMKNDPVTNANGPYVGTLNYKPGPSPGIEYYLSGTLYGPNGYYMVMGWSSIEVAGHDIKMRSLILYDSNDIEIEMKTIRYPTDLYDNVSPSSLIFGTVTVYLHYIRATLLTQSADGVQENVLDTGDYYKGMSAFEGSGLQVTITANTSEQPNGHRMVPGSDEYGGTPQYFAPPNTTQNWIPLAEDNWNYASMWYTIEPSVANGLTDPEKYGTFRWTRCWTIGCCINALLKRISSGKIVFAETPDYSQFLYGSPNPLQGHEQFQYLITQKSNVMRPGTAQATRCIVRLQWFLELLQNAFNCYYWLERRNDGKYDFKVEHVEYLRNGGSYTDSLASQLDLTALKPHRNFFRNGQAVKRYADQTNKYSFDLSDMAEKYTFSWQGDGGSDDFKGNPMCFRAGWIDKGKSESHEVDNIFADLGWLMLNAGTKTASSKNYEGVFLFAGYRPALSNIWSENKRPATQSLTLASGTSVSLNIDIWATIPSGETVTLKLDSTPMQTFTGMGEPQLLPVRIDIEYTNPHTITLDFGADFYNCIIHRIHAAEGNIFYVPNVENLLHPGNNLQNGPLAWPWLQNEFLHYDIPANKWSFDSDDPATATYLDTGTIKLVKKQSVSPVPFPAADPLTNQGIKTGLGIGLIDSAKVNLGSRNVELTLLYDINPQNI